MHSYLDPLVKKFALIIGPPRYGPIFMVHTLTASNIMAFLLHLRNVTPTQSLLTPYKQHSLEIIPWFSSLAKSLSTCPSFLAHSSISISSIGTSKGSKMPWSLTPKFLDLACDSHRKVKKYRMWKSYLRFDRLMKK